MHGCHHEPWWRHYSSSLLYPQGLAQTQPEGRVDGRKCTEEVTLEANWRLLANYGVPWVNPCSGQT